MPLEEKKKGFSIKASAKVKAVSSKTLSRVVAEDGTLANAGAILGAQSLNVGKSCRGEKPPKGSDPTC